MFFYKTGHRKAFSQHSVSWRFCTAAKVYGVERSSFVPSCIDDFDTLRFRDNLLKHSLVILLKCHLMFILKEKIILTRNLYFPQYLTAKK